MKWDLITTIVDRVKAGQVTASELVDGSLQSLAANQQFNATLAVLSDSARQQATAIDARLKQGLPCGRLCGIPFIAKDNFLAFGAPTTAASHMLSTFNAPYQATAIEKLEAAGAILVAKANLDAFAHGSSTENSAFGATLNPYDQTRVPGGSSGGSAAAVALDMVPFALGTDTGGSIRLPASYCGVVGYKPTYGLISRYGVVAMASSTDVIGPLAKKVEDVALVLDIMSGRDQFDSTTIERDQASYVSGLSQLKGKSVGVVKEYFGQGLDVHVRALLNQTLAKLKQAGVKIVDVSLPSVDLALACYYIIVPAEVSSNLSRYDGQRYGLNVAAASNLDESYQQAREAGFEAENKRRIMIGSYVLSSGFYDAYYRRAQTVRTKLINEFANTFQQFDFLVGPTAPTTAFKLGQNTANPLQMYLADIMTVAANLVGIPAISLPIGAVNGLPVGMQLMGPQKADRQLLAFAKQIQDIIS